MLRASGNLKLIEDLQSAPLIFAEETLRQTFEQRAQVRGRIVIKRGFPLRSPWRTRLEQGVAASADAVVLGNSPRGAAEVEPERRVAALLVRDSQAHFWEEEPASVEYVSCVHCHGGLASAPWPPRESSSLRAS